MNALNKPIFLGCIADDVTGATDIASNLVQAGMRTVQVFGVPRAEDLERIEADAVVIALKSRSIDPALAVSMSLQSLTALRETGTERFFFKYCSTFDSTPTGNIGPVADALMTELGVPQTVFCPSFPANGRTVYQGHLFVNGQLLNESGMQNHPLNPMTDANLVRVLQAQTNRKVGLVDWNDISRGHVASAMESLRDDGVAMVITDACDDQQLRSLAQQLADLPFLTGGSGIARWLPHAWRDAGLFNEPESDAYRPSVSGRAAVLSGSCSRATNAQVNYLKSRVPSLELDVERLVNSFDETMATVEQFFHATPPPNPVMVYSTCGPDRLNELQQTHGVETLAEAIESAMGALAQCLVNDHGVRRLIVAGGETSGAITKRLNMKAIRVGPEICPGVPWTETVSSNPLTLVLKSGNFGDDQFFETAIRVTT